MKLFVYKAFKCEVVNVEFFSRDLYFQIFLALILILFRITASVSRLSSQFRKHRHSEQQPLRREIFKIFRKWGER